MSLCSWLVLGNILMTVGNVGIPMWCCAAGTSHLHQVSPSIPFPKTFPIAMFMHEMMVTTFQSRSLPLHVPARHRTCVCCCLCLPRTSQVTHVYLSTPPGPLSSRSCPAKHGYVTVRLLPAPPQQLCAMHTVACFGHAVSQSCH